MLQSEREFLEECAELVGKTLEELTADDNKFWGLDDGTVKQGG